MSAEPGATSDAPPTVHIRPQASGWRAFGLRQILAHHELLYFLVLRMVKLRYKQTVFGAAWAVLQPLLAMLAFTLIFGRFARLPSEGLPYAIFAYTALLPWTYLANALTTASNSLVDNERMLTKVYFPRALLPLAAVLAGLLDAMRRSYAANVLRHSTLPVFFRVCVQFENLRCCVVDRHCDAQSVAGLEI